ncbi:MAG: PQQ-dependent sugar dehydrogenase, partial [Gammaproteobacteria bacterium]
MRSLLLSSIAVGAMAFAGLALGQSAETVPTENLQKLSGMQATGTSMAAFQPVPQNDDYAAQLRKNLEQVKLPPGFKINLYAVVPDARHIAVGPQGVVTFVGTRKNKVWAVTDRDKDRVGDEVKEFAPSIPFAIPNGVCFSRDGFLFIAEQNRVLVFPAAEFFYEGPDVAVIEVVPQGRLVPEEEESYNHGARTCRVADDGKLYITLGQPYNVQPREKIALYEKLGIGGVVRMDPFSGGGRETYARGMRNPVGITVNPKDKTLWTTDNQTDGMGDD